MSKKNTEERYPHPLSPSFPTSLLLLLRDYMKENMRVAKPSRCLFLSGGKEVH